MSSLFSIFVVVVPVADGVAGAEGFAVRGGDDVAAVVDDADHAAGAELAVEVGAWVWKSGRSLFYFKLFE